MQKIKTDGKIIYQVKEDDIHLAVDMVTSHVNDHLLKEFSLDTPLQQVVNR